MPQSIARQNVPARRKQKARHDGSRPGLRAEAAQLWDCCFRGRRTCSRGARLSFIRTDVSGPGLSEGDVRLCRRPVRTPGLLRL